MTDEPLTWEAIERLRRAMPKRKRALAITKAPFGDPAGVLHMFDDEDELFFIGADAMRGLERLAGDARTVVAPGAITSILGIRVEEYDFDRHYPTIRKISRGAWLGADPRRSHTPGRHQEEHHR